MAQPPRVVIIGAGPAGVRCAETLVAAGLRPTVVDENRRDGGQIYRRQPDNFTRPYTKLYGTEAGRAQALHACFDALRAHVDYHPNTLAWNIADQQVHVACGEQASALPFDALVICAGATDRLMPVKGWQLAGTYSLGAAQIALKAQAMMQAVGINAQVEVLDWPVQLERYNKGDFQVSSFTYSSRLDPGLSYEQLVGDKDKEPRKVWDDPVARRLVESSLVESDPKKRQALFDEAHALMLRQVPLILLYNGIDTWAVRPRISGFSVWEGKPRAWNTRVAQAQ